MNAQLVPTDPWLVASVKLGEGLRLTAYADPRSPLGVQLALPLAKRAPGWMAFPGNPWTCGYGSTRGVKQGDVWTQAQADEALNADLTDAFSDLDIHAPWWRILTLNRQRVLAELCFNMGWRSPDGKHGLSTFVNTLAAMQRGDIETAAEGLENSAWAHEVGPIRANRLVSEWRAG